MSEKDENLKSDGVSKKIIIPAVIILLLLGIIAIIKFTGNDYSNPYAPGESSRGTNSRVTYVAENHSESNVSGEQTGSIGSESGSENQSSGESNDDNGGNAGSSTGNVVTPESTKAPAMTSGAAGSENSGNSGSNTSGTGNSGNNVSSGGNSGDSGNSGSGNSGNSGTGNSGNGGSTKATPTPQPVGTGNSGGTTSTGTPVSVHGQLSVKGSQLVDKNGNAFQLKGVSTHGIAWFPEYVNKAAFTSLRDEWGCNVVRLAMYTAEYGGYCSGGNKSDLKQLVNNGVSYATDLGMYVIIDWHILSDSNPNTNKSDAIAFFDEMSKKYANYNNVIYEICNEPNGGTSWSTIKSYANEVIGTIRKNDKDAIIIVGTPTWSQDVDQAAASPITGYSNIMYSLHFYAATHTDWLRTRMVDAINKGLPVFVTEFGICDASGNGACDISQANSWVETMDKYGVSYVCWNFANKAESSSQIKSSVSKTSGWTYNDLSTEGQWLVDTLGGSIAKYTSGAKKSTTGGNPKAPTNTPTPVPTKTPTKAPTNTPTKAPTKAPNSNPTNTPAPSKAPSSGNSSGVTANISTPNSWPIGDHMAHQFTYNVVNGKSTELNGWTVTITFSAEVTNVEGWNATYSLSGKTLTIKPSEDWAKKIGAGQTFSAGFRVEGPEGVTVTSIKVS